MCKSCFLFGHADCPDTVLSQIEEVIERNYSKYGVTNFYVGNRGRFDSLASTAIKRVKQRHAEIRLYMLLAYHPAERPIELSQDFDGSYYPPLENVPRSYAIVRANQYMVNTSDLIICYVWHHGNTRALLEMAYRKKIPTINLADREHGDGPAAPDISAY